MIFVLKVNQKLGKYRIEKRISEGGFAAVYQAMDTIEGVRVALKAPHARHLNDEMLSDFRHEARLAARLEHPHILPLKNADVIDGHMVIAFPLGEKTLADRLQSRMGLGTALDYADQMCSAVAYAHAHHIIHCDIKPENFILFPGANSHPGGVLRLTDFGIAKVSLRTLRASGSGTVGYIAPEQAMGRPSFRSDVFSLGLVLYRMLSGHLPEWPFAWPPPGYPKIRRKLHPELLDLVRRAMEISPDRRYRDGIGLHNALRRVKSRALKFGAPVQSGVSSGVSKDWRTVRRRQFLREYGQVLQTVYQCRECEGPVSECMQSCPWCGASRAVHRDETRFPLRCPRCQRGLKLDWTYCPWCYGGGFNPHANRRYTDVRYEGKCSNAKCPRKDLMPFMRYCPWCHRKVRRKWKIPGSQEKCPGCQWGVLFAYWSYCPWCGKDLPHP